MSDALATTIINTLEEADRAASMPIGVNKYTTHEDNIRGLDAIGNSLAMAEVEMPGYMFVTRPRCNLSIPSIRTDRILAMLDTFDKDSLALGIRALLDTNLHKLYSQVNDPKYVDLTNPFIPILTNRLESLNGWPDPVLEVESSDPGFFGENITYPKGFDQLAKAYTLTANFKEIQGTYIMSLFLIWCRYLETMVRGATTQYPQDIEARRMGFTSSIYRFTLDPSKKFIVKWAKATGCFPQSNNLGKYFNYDKSSTGEVNREPVSIQFAVAGNVGYLEPVILAEFNTLVRRYCQNIEDRRIYIQAKTPEEKALYNYKLIPYIDLGDYASGRNGTNELMWFYRRDIPVGGGL